MINNHEIFIFMHLKLKSENSIYSNRIVSTLGRPNVLTILIKNWHLLTPYRLIATAI